jgi:hypothetical protein
MGGGHWAHKRPACTRSAIQKQILGREIEAVNSSAPLLEVAHRLHGKKVSNEFFAAGDELLQPCNSQDHFCGIAGNCFSGLATMAIWIAVPVMHLLSGIPTGAGLPPNHRLVSNLRR